MDESHSNATNHKQNDLQTKFLIDYQNTKVSQVHPMPIYIYDAPNDLGLSILQALFQIAINPFHSSHIYSAYILPDNLNRIFFEASDLKSVRRTLRYISGIKSVPKNLPVIRGEQINQFFINPVGCLHFHPGQIVTIHNPEFDNQIGQIVDIKKESGKILIKTYPHIDYDFLRRHKKFTTQTQINESKGPDYKAPMVPFNKEGLATTNSLIPIWNSQVNAIKWDNKIFIGKFQYVWINYKEITHKKLNELTENEKRVFLEGISDYEKMNPSFIKGFNGQLNFEGTHTSDSILQISLNKGMPTWAHKKSRGKSLLSDSESDSGSDSDSNLSKPQNNISRSQKTEINNKNAKILSNSNRNVQFSQKVSIPSNKLDDADDVPPDFPDFDDDDIGNDYNQNNNNFKQRKIMNSPVFVGSTSSDSESDNKKSNSKLKKDNINSKSRSNDKSGSKIANKTIDGIILTSSDSDIDSLFNISTNKKSSKDKSSTKKSQAESHRNEKLKSNSKPNHEKQSDKSNQNKSKNRSSKQTSQFETENKSNQKSNLNTIKSILDSSSESSSDSNNDKDSGPKNSKKPKNIIIVSSESPDLYPRNESTQKMKNFLDSTSSDSSSESHIGKNGSKKIQKNKTTKKILNSSSEIGSDDETKQTANKRNLLESSDYSDVEIIEPEKVKKDKEYEIKKKKKKEGQKKLINKLFKDSIDYGKSPPSEKIYFGYASDSDDDDQGVEVEPTLDRASILEEQSQQISKRKMRKYYKKKDLPIPEEYLSDSYSLDSDSSSSSSS